jgi:hypothetical protein
MSPSAERRMHPFAGQRVAKVDGELEGGGQLLVSVVEAAQSRG